MRRDSLSGNVSSQPLRAYLDRYTPRPLFGGWYFPSPKRSRYDVDNFSQALRAANQKSLKLPAGSLKFTVQGTGFG